MEDDRRPSGPGEPSPTPPGQHDDQWNSPDPGTDRHVDARRDPGSGRPGPAGAPRHGSDEADAPQEYGTPESAPRTTETTGWRPASPSSPYTIPTAGPHASGAAEAPRPPHHSDPFAAAAHPPPAEPPSPTPEAPVHGNADSPYGPGPSYTAAPDGIPGYGSGSESRGSPRQDSDPLPPGGGHTHAHERQAAPPHSTGPTYSTGIAPAGSGDAYGAGADPFAPGSGHPYTHEHQAAPPHGGTGPTYGAAPAGSGDGSGAPPVPPGFDPGYTGGAPEPVRKPRRSRKGLVVGIVSTLVVLALVGGGVSWYVLTMPRPEDTATAYAQAWNSQDYGSMAGLAEGGDPHAFFTRLEDDLGVEAVQVSTGRVDEGEDTATVPFEATLDLSNAGEWTYSGELPLVRADREWKVDFGPAAVHPDLGDGQTLVRTNQWGERGHVLAADGSRLDDGSASGSVQMIVGEVGTASEEDLSDLGPAYEAGDPVGVSGVQKSYEERLAGKAAAAIRVAEAGTEAQDVGEDAPTVATLGGSDGKDVQLSLDPAVQAAAAQAIVGQSKPTAIAAVRPSTGEVLAAANVPGGFNRALEGQYPAGSIFKIISYHALLNSGMGMDTPMNCPETVNVGGRTYKNAGDAAYGAQSVTQAFATSCNTALVREVGDRLDGASLLESAERFGFNTGFASGLQVFKPSLPQPDSVSLLTASSIGQGKVLTSPLHLASLPAAVADGSWRAPLLVNDPAPDGRPEPRPLDNAQHLRDMTRAVVTNGTAKDVGFSGEVHGKSGTAEYGTAEEGEELPAHAWFVGYEGDVAFAVVVEDGESGSGAAAPLAKDFLDAL